MMSAAGRDILDETNHTDRVAWLTVEHAARQYMSTPRRSESQNTTNADLESDQGVQDKAAVDAADAQRRSPSGRFAAPR